uniref:Uncharacterized protein n=1 Tax=Paramormyrops kingsleyae TaxID=1676925 RepID=A0A3B3R989_9TELE
MNSGTYSTGVRSTNAIPHVVPKREEMYEFQDFGAVRSHKLIQQCPDALVLLRGGSDRLVAHGADTTYLQPLYKTPMETTGEVSDKQRYLTVPHPPSAVTVPHQPSAVTVPHQPSAVIVPHKPSAVIVPHQPSAVTVPHQPSAVTVPHQPSVVTVPHQRSAVTVPHQPSVVTVQPRGHHILRHLIVVEGFACSNDPRS